MKYDDDGKELLSTYPEVKEAITYIELVWDNEERGRTGKNCWGILMKNYNDPNKVMRYIADIIIAEKAVHGESRISHIGKVISQFDNPQFLQYITNKMYLISV